MRLVLAHDDPGVHNWLDTQGFRDGNLTYRNLLSQNPATFRTRLVKRADLMDHLPADTAMVSPQERAAMLLDRYPLDQAEVRDLGRGELSQAAACALKEAIAGVRWTGGTELT